VICAAFRGPRCPPRSFRAHSFAPNGHRESSLCPDQHQIWYLVRTAHCRNSRQVANLGQTWRARAASWKGLWTTSVRFSSQRRKEQSDRQPRPLLTYNLWLPRHFPRRLPAPPWSSLSLLVLAFFDGLYFDHCRRCQRRCCPLLWLSEGYVHLWKDTARRNFDLLGRRSTARKRSPDSDHSARTGIRAPPSPSVTGRATLLYRALRVA